ncbi:hypothetical protein HYX05_04280 [Candidatus Woesearchaeota archaeon]|nr:hypothetical protein [Candidatus Woesearchaeota archaeon]
MDRRAFLTGASAYLGLSAIANKAYAVDISPDGKLNVTADFLRELSSYLNRFAFGSRELKHISIKVREGNYQYSTAYGLETIAVKDMGHSYKLTQLKKGQPLVVWTRDLSDLSKPVFGRADANLDGRIDRLFKEIHEGTDVQKLPFSKLTQSEKVYHQDEFERALRALRRKMNV